MMSTSKSTVWIYVRNLGDGSAAPKFFTSKKAAEAYAKYDDERFCDDIYPREFDIEDGKIVIVDERHYDEKTDQPLYPGVK